MTAGGEDIGGPLDTVDHLDTVARPNTFCAQGAGERLSKSETAETVSTVDMAGSVDIGVSVDTPDTLDSVGTFGNVDDGEALGTVATSDSADTVNRLKTVETQDSLRSLDAQPRHCAQGRHCRQFRHWRRCGDTPDTNGVVECGDREATGDTAERP